MTLAFTDGLNLELWAVANSMYALYRNKVANLSNFKLLSLALIYKKLGNFASFQI
jgi:hypothetical protein